MWIYIVIGYCVVGFILGIKHLSSGMVGAKGPMVTLLAHVLIWPLLKIMK